MVNLVLVHRAQSDSIPWQNRNNQINIQEICPPRGNGLRCISASAGNLRNRVSNCIR